MVFLILSPEGFEEIFSEIEEMHSPVWVTSNVLSREQVNKYREAGMELTVFDHTIDHTNNKELQNEIELIQLHHPSQTVTVQT